jgi:hypothetical protein
VSEFFAPCHAREGENGSGAARLPAPWVKEGKKLAQGDWWPADLPEIAALNGLLGWAGVAFRYRPLVALRHDKLLTLPLPRISPNVGNASSTRLGILDKPALAPAALFAPAAALQVEHGHAYVLSDGAAFRLPLGQLAQRAADGKATSTSDAKLSALPVEFLTPVEHIEPGALEDEIYDDFMAVMPEYDIAYEESIEEPMGARLLDAGLSTAIEASADLPTELSQTELSQVVWKLQTTTPTRWLALGEMAKQAVGVQCNGFEARFLAHPLAAPPVLVSTWRQLLACGETILLVAENGLWCENQSHWAQLWATPATETFRGALPGQEENEVWLWGEDQGDSCGLWMRRLDLNQAASQASIGPLLRVPGAHWRADEGHKVEAGPVRLGDTFYFWVRTPRGRFIAALDTTAPNAPRETLTLNQQTVWALGAQSQAGDFLVYALDDGTDVELVARCVRPLETNSWSVKKIRPHRRLTSGSPLAATLCDGRLSLAALEEIGGQIVARGYVFDLSETG